jgi:DNA-directed RNA polymerase alpha subunit
MEEMSMNMSRIVSSVNARLLLAYNKSQARKTEKLVEESKMEEVLRGTDIRDIGLQGLVVACLRCKEIDSVLDLIWYSKQELLSDPQINPTGLKQIEEQLGLLGLTMSD